MTTTRTHELLFACTLLTRMLSGCGAEPIEIRHADSSLPARVDAHAAPAVDRVLREQVAINGLVFDVRAAGPVDGEVVFLLHGFPQTSYQWRAQMPVLAAAGYRVIAPDLRGFSPGARPVAVLEYNIVNYIDDLLKMAAHYDAPRFHVVGHDVGGMVAWGAAMLFPEKISSLTALSVPHPAAYAKQLADPESCQRKASWWYTEVMKPGAAAQEALWSILEDSWSNMQTDARAEYKRVLGTPDAIESVLNVWRANFSAELELSAALPLPVQVPTVYVWGDRDEHNCGDGEALTRQLCPVSYRYAKLEGVSHWVSEDAPEALNRILLEHLGGRALSRLNVGARGPR